MADLKLSFLGELTVERDGKPQRLPPSKKTRALLAYLALNDRAFRREHLCELLWEIPDDPRGSLRWSLSKLRKLVDEDELARIVADRSSVSFAAEGAWIDCERLRQLAEDEIDSADTATLAEAVETFQGGFLEGLELSQFHEFYAWCIAQREQVLRHQVVVLRALTQRLAQQPEQCLPYLQQLCALQPYEEEDRAALIRCLVQLGRDKEAEQQYRFGKKMQEEVGSTNEQLLYRAWRGKSTSEGEASRKDTPSVTTAAAAAADIIGRGAELQALQDSLQGSIAHSHAGGLMLLGEPGIGKTSMLARARELAGSSGALIIDAEALETEIIRPFALWTDAFRRNHSARLPELFSGEGRSDRDSLFGSLSELLAELSAEQPVALLFDDIQWSDESSIAALHYLMRMNRERPLWVVLAARETELQHNAGAQTSVASMRREQLLHTLKLERLDETTLRDIISVDSPDADCERLSRECGGNPLLAIELARAESQGSTAGTLEQLMRERLSRFDAQATEILRWAAVLAPNIDLNSLEKATGEARELIDRVLGAAEQQGILRASPQGFRFTHHLVSTAIYEDTPLSRRQTMHRRVAELLEVATALDLKRAADLAHHASLSGDSALGARAMVQAGRLCQRFYANDDALKLVERGLQFAADLPDADRVCLTLDLEEIRLNSAPLEDSDAAVALYVELAEHALDHGALQHARLGYQLASYVRWVRGQWSDAQRESLQAELVTRGGTDEEHIIGMAEASRCLAMLERDLTQADALLMEARSRAERKRVSAACIPAAAGLLKFFEGKFDEAEELLQDARARYKVEGDRVNEYQANEYLAMMDIERGDFGAAQRHCDALLEIGERLRDGSEKPFAHALQALCSYAEDADTDLESSTSELRNADAKQRLAVVLNRAAALDEQAGRNGLARERATEALQHATVLDRKSEMLLAHLVLARLARSESDTDAFADHRGQLEALASDTGAQWARRYALEYLQSVAAEGTA